MGYYTAEFLSRKNHDVVIIEVNKTRAEEMSEKLNATVICGNAMEIKNLQEADVENADVLLACTGDDESNILISMLGRQLGAKRIITRITHLEYNKQIFEKLGIDSIVYPELSVVTQIEQMVEDPTITGFATLDEGKVEIVEFSVPEQGMEGRTYDSLKLPENSKIIGTIRDDKTLVVSPSTEIRPKDKVLVLTNKDELQKVEDVFSR